MARKSLLVLVAGVAAAGIIATGAAAGAALTDPDSDSDDGFGVAASTEPGSGVPSDGVAASSEPGLGVPSGGFTPPSDDGSTPSGDPARPSDAVNLDEAIGIALAKTAGGTVVDTEREWEHGRPAWKVEIVKGGVEHDVYVDRETGTIVKYDRDDDDDHSGSGSGGDDDRSGKGRGDDD